MSQPPQPLTEQQRQQLIWQAGHALASAIAPGWQEMRFEYRGVGRHVEADLLVTGQDGLPHPLQPHPEAVRLLGMLRAGVYEPGRGTWLGAIVVYGRSTVLSTDFMYDLEPPWRQAPPPVAFTDELRFFPRADEHLPGWLRERAGLAPAPVATPVAATPEALRSPRVYDGLDESGRPVVDREPLTAAEREQVLEYLDNAPVVLAARSFSADAFDPGREPTVPMNFRTDGSWFWPGAVAYYLREHEVPPDPEFLAHIRARQFALPDVEESQRDLAIAAITQQ